MAQGLQDPSKKHIGGKKTKNWDTAERIADLEADGVKQDLPIWQNKVHRKKPLLCEADGHLAEFRKWVKQFYSE